MLVITNNYNDNYYYDYFNMFIMINNSNGSNNIDYSNMIILIYLFLKNNFYNGFLNLIGKVYF
jgi:hypothetical protein